MSSILFLTAERTAAVAEPEILGMPPLTSLSFVLLTSLLVSIASTFLTGLSHSSFLATSFFTILLNLLKSVVVIFNLPISNSSIILFKLFKALGTRSNSSISNL